jgi:hypothetical protein
LKPIKGRKCTLAVLCVAAPLSSSALAETPVATAAFKCQGGEPSTAKITNPVSPIVVSYRAPADDRTRTGSDRRYQVLYELQLVNTLGRPADLRSVEVLDAGNGRSLLTLSAAEIVKGDYLHTLDRQLATSTSFAPFEGLGNHGDHNVAFRSPGDNNPPICAMVSCAATKSIFTMLLCVPSACSPVGSGACLSHFAPNMDRRRAWSCGVSHIRLNALSRARNSRIVEISPGHDRSVSARLHLGLEVDTRTG